MHADRERKFFKSLIHFQMQGLKIFERKQNYIQQLEQQLKSQEKINRASETSHANEAAMQQKAQEAEQQLQ